MSIRPFSGPIFEVWAVPASGPDLFVDSFSDKSAALECVALNNAFDGELFDYRVYSDSSDGLDDL